MEYALAPSYKDYETVGSPYFKNGKMYTRARIKCDRCVNGVYVCRIENGQPVPHPVAGGVCFQCGGSGYISKEVRLYTVEEAEKMEKRNEAARIKREQEREAKMKAEFADNKRKWLEKNGFTQDGVTYIVMGDSFSIKDELKAAGFIFDPVLRWHKADPAGYEDRVKKVELDQVIEMSAWGEGHYISGAKDYVDNLLTEDSEDKNSEWIGEKGSRYTFENVIFVSRRGFNGRFGYSNVYTFRTEEGNLLTWFSTVNVDKEVGDVFTLAGTVKDHSEYKGIKSTVLSRCKVK